MPKGCPGTGKNNPHGDIRRYVAGCRCAECRSANATYCRMRRTKECTRRMNLKANYGISLEDYAEMSSAQGGVCAACGCAETGKNQYGPVPLAVDHCHATGKIRGLLCMRCNRALGLLADDPIRVENLLTYRNLHR